jgi:WD40 repeat protein
MEQHKINSLWLLSLVVLMMGCSVLGSDSPPPRVTPRPTPVLTPVFPTQPLTSKTSPRVTELANLSSGMSGPVAALAFTPDSRELLSVHGTEEVLQRWQVENGVLLRTLDIGPVGMAAVAFDGQARLLAIGAGRTEPAIQAGYDVRFGGVHVWDTQSGELILDTSEEEPYARYITDVALSYDGRWLAKVYEGGITFVNAETGVYDFGFSREAYESPIQPTITAATFGPTGTWMGYADDLGWVEIKEWYPKAELPWKVKHGGEEKTPVPLALAIDLSQHRMAMVTTEMLIVWDLQAQFNKMVIEESVPSSPLAGLVFSPDGSLLAVGTASGWQLWSVEDRKLLLEDERAAYALAFNRNGHLFAWGDTEGSIHLWGVPGP